MARRVPRQRGRRYRRTGERQPDELSQSFWWWLLISVLAFVMALTFWFVVLVVVIAGLPGWDW